MHGNARFLLVLLFIPLVVGINIYAYRRLIRDVTDSVRIRRMAALAMGLAGLGIPLMRYTYGDVLPPPWIAIGVMTWWGFLLGTLITLPFVELIARGVRRADARKRAPDSPEDPARRLLIARTMAGTAAAMSASVVGYGMRRAFESPEVSEVSVKLPNLPRALDGFTIVQLSDIHIGSIIQERFLDQLVEAANGAKPDLVAITGDLVDGHPGQLGRFVARFRNLKSRYGTHFVSGNHDWYSGWDDWAPVLSGMGFRVLRNERVRIGDEASLDLLGVDDWGARVTGNGYDLEKALAGRDESRASVLLAHQPQNLPVVSAANIGLQLSGHTHGGQVFPGTLIADSIWGAQNTGLSRVGNTFQYTSRGCGFVGPPMRVGAPPEVVKIVLTA